jgi:type III secretory pathway component EscS
MQFLYMTIILCLFVPFVAVAIGIYVSLVGAALFAQAYRVGWEQADRGSAAA